jgi:DNA-binding PadR family transcriptional regulator
MNSLTTSGLISRTTLPTKIPQITDERYSYRLTDLGSYEAAGTASRSLRRVLTSIMQARTADGWAEEDDIWMVAYPGYGHRHAVRFRLRKLTDAGLLETLSTPEEPFTTVYALRPKAVEYLRRRSERQGFAMPAVCRPPRMDQIVHHLLTVQTCLTILAASGAEPVRFLGDEELRSEQRKGRRSRRGRREDKLPDGRLEFTMTHGESRTAEIEVLTSKYTDETILRKYQELTEGTIFAAPTERLALRMKYLTGYNPLVIRP